jgi:L-rhamnose mutarotase
MAQHSVRHFGMVIGLKPDCIADYRALHDGPGVRDLLNAANIRNFTIFLTVMPDGKTYEFAYYQYVGSDYEADMARLNADPRNKAWLAQCDPMQIPLPGHKSWKMMESIFFQP